MFKNYYQLAKPGIIYGNAITMLAGFILASNGNINWILLLATFVGQSAIIASGCILNNIADMDIDAKMERTKNRALVLGLISRKKAYTFSLALLIVGSAVLIYFTNMLAFGVAIFGYLIYAFIYTPLKRKTDKATLIGAFSGATPPLIGFTAVANQLPFEALYLYLMFFFWQLPHFYSIAIYRLEDYRAAQVPIYPLVHGIKNTKIYILIYICVFLAFASLLFVYKYLGYIYFIVLIVLSLWWLWRGSRGLGLVNERLWARKMFRWSLVVVLFTSLAIAGDVFFK